MKKIKIEKRNYIRYGAAIAALIVFVFFLPQMVLGAQDLYQRDRIWQGTRNGLDTAKIYSEYGDLRERMEAFSRRLAEDYTFYVAGTEHRVDEEFFEILDDVTRQEGYEMLLAFGIAPDLSEVVNKGYTVNEWKKYVIYNDITEEEKNAVIMSGWYMEFTLRDDITVKMLVDTETYELYYMKLADYSDTEEILTDKEKVLKVDPLEYWMEFWFDYYEAGENLIQTFEGYMSGLGEEAIHFVIHHETENYGVHRITMGLPYGKYRLEWKAEAVLSKDERIPNSFSVGLTDLAVLIPEFQEITVAG